MSTLAEMRECASWPRLCSCGASRWIFGLPVWLMPNGNLLKVFSLYLFLDHKKQAEWVRLVFHGSCLQLGSLQFFSCFFLICRSLSPFPSLLFLPHFLPSPCLSTCGIFLCVCFHPCSCVFSCMCICVNMQAETSRQPWLLYSGTLYTLRRVSLAWSSYKRLECLARGTEGSILLSASSSGITAYPPRLPFFTCILGISLRPSWL